MTTGLITYGSTSGPEYYYRYWSGADGSYDLVNGVRIRRINPYVMIQRRQVIKAGVGGGWPQVNIESSADILTSNDRLALLSKVASAAKEHQFNLGIAAVEFDKTVRLVYETIHRFSRSIKALKRGNFALAAKELGVRPIRGQKRSHGGNVAAMWLELQYGWMPLAKDIYNLAKVVEQKNNAYPRSLRFAVTIKRSSVIKNASTVPSYVKAPAEITNTWQCIAYVVEKNSEARNIGLMDPAAVAWERIPFSFVADWFIPIGNYLEVLNAIPELNATYCMTKRIKSQAYCYFAPDKGYEKFATAELYRDCAGGYNYTKISRERYVPTSIPFPEFKPWDKSLSPGHLWNALALLVSVLKV